MVYMQSDGGDDNCQIQSFVLCLHYLSQEARRENQLVVASIIANAINLIEKWIDGKNPDIKENIFDDSLYNALEFLSKFSAMSDGNQIAISRMLEVGDTEEEAYFEEEAV